jgi:gas vesicle protein
VHRELHAPEALLISPESGEELVAVRKRKFNQSTKVTQTIMDESQRLARTYGDQLMAACEQVLDRRK